MPMWGQSTHPFLRENVVRRSQSKVVWLSDVLKGSKRIYIKGSIPGHHQRFQVTKSWSIFCMIWGYPHGLEALDLRFGRAPLPSFACAFWLGPKRTWRRNMGSRWSGRPRTSLCSFLMSENIQEYDLIGNSYNIIYPNSPFSVILRQYIWESWSNVRNIIDYHIIW